MQRFSGVDPLAMDFANVSPYVYTLNNPVFLVDPDGKAPIPPHEYTVYHDKDGTVREVRKTSNKGGNDHDKVTHVYGTIPEAGSSIKTLEYDNQWGANGQRDFDADGVPVGFIGYHPATGAITPTDNPIEWALEAPIKGTISTGIVLFAIFKNKGDNLAKSAVKKKLRNGHLAGGVHDKTKVPFTTDGFPDFSEPLYKGGKNDVMIKPTGNRAKDFSAANKAAGYSSTPKGYTWHHHQSTGRMQLVNSSIHSKTGHTGGFSLWKF